MEVNIYINAHHTGNLSKGIGKYAIVLEYVKKNGEPTTMEIFKGVNKTTKNRTALFACIEAATHIVKPCFLNFHINNHYVALTMQEERFFHWNFEDWTNSGKPVKNADLWRTLFKLFEPHKVSFEYTDNNTYSNYTDTMLQRIEIKYIEDRKG